MHGDERLAQLVGEGNDRAFGTLYARFHQPLYRYCHSMLRHDADAQDALQSTFASALVALRRGQRDAPLRPWLFRIAHNESVSLLRRRRPADELPETMESSALSVEAAADERARLSQLVADLHELPERQRGALVMRELSGLSHEDMAQALGISVGAAKQTVFEARRALAEFEEGRAMPCEQIQRVISDGDRRALRGRKVRAHLRGCASCTRFAGSIPERRTALMALAPALPAAAASGLFAQITGAGSAHHGGGSVLAGATGKGLGAAISTKALATGAAIVATAAAGTVGIVKVITHSGPPSRPAGLSGSSRGAGSGAAGSAGHRAGGSRSSSAGAAHRGGAARNDSGQAAGVAKLFGLSGSGRAASANQPGGFGGSGGASGSSRSAGSEPGAGWHGQGNSGQGKSLQNPSATNPNSHGSNPNAGGANAGAGSSNPNAHAGNPKAAGGRVNAHGSNPTPAAHRPPPPPAAHPKPSTGSTNAHGSNPNATSTTTTRSINPRAAGAKVNAHAASASTAGASAHS